MNQFVTTPCTAVVKMESQRLDQMERAVNSFLSIVKNLHLGVAQMVYLKHQEKTSPDVPNLNVKVLAHARAAVIRDMAAAPTVWLQPLGPITKAARP